MTNADPHMAIFFFPSLMPNIRIFGNSHMADERIHYYSMWRVYHPGDLREKKNNKTNRQAADKVRIPPQRNPLFTRFPKQKTFQRARCSLSAPTSAPQPVQVLSTFSELWLPMWEGRGMLSALWH